MCGWLWVCGHTCCAWRCQSTGTTWGWSYRCCAYLMWVLGLELRPSARVSHTFIHLVLTPQTHTFYVTVGISGFGRISTNSRNTVVCLGLLIPSLVWTHPTDWHHRSKCSMRTGGTQWEVLRLERWLSLCYFVCPVRFIDFPGDSATFAGMRPVC